MATSWVWSVGSGQSRPTPHLGAPGIAVHGASVTEVGVKQILGTMARMAKATVWIVDGNHTSTVGPILRYQIVHIRD